MGRTNVKEGLSHDDILRFLHVRRNHFRNTSHFLIRYPIYWRIEYSRYVEYAKM